MWLDCIQRLVVEVGVAAVRDGVGRNLTDRLAEPPAAGDEAATA
jgi:hypothetical protein